MVLEDHPSKASPQTIIVSSFYILIPTICKKFIRTKIKENKWIRHENK